MNVFTFVKTFIKKKKRISNSYFIRHRLPGFHCESDIDFRGSFESDIDFRGSL